MEVQPPTWVQWQSEQIWIRVRRNVVDLLIHKNKQILTRTNSGTDCNASMESKWPNIVDGTLVLYSLRVDNRRHCLKMQVCGASQFKHKWILFFHSNWMMLNSDFLPLLHFCCRPLFLGGKSAKSVERCIAAVIFELTIDLEPNWPIWTSHPC